MKNSIKIIDYNSILILAGFIFVVAACGDKDSTGTSSGEDNNKNNAVSIMSITPEKGNAGTKVTIIGSHFSDTKADNMVKFGDVEANIISYSHSKLIVKVPQGISTGKQSVTATIGGKTATAPNMFNVISSSDNFDGSLKVLELNTWKVGTEVPGGFEAIVNVILQTKADIVLLAETRDSRDKKFSDHITDRLKKKGEKFYVADRGKDTIILSKFPITQYDPVNSSSVTKGKVQLERSLDVSIYAAHLDYKYYACELPRGYDGNTYEELPQPVTNVDKILQQNRESQRDEAIDTFLNDASRERKKGNIVLMGGDFNEPSDLDWTKATKNLFDHHGTVVPWSNSVKLSNNGYVDTYRKQYPDPVSHPGFTWPAYNSHVKVSKLTWAPKADERDRIDFIYYHKDERVTFKNVIIVGPSGSIVRGKGVEDSTSDKFLEPKGIWPSDHKGVLATFKIQTNSNNQEN